ncbi:hypothetical protein GCM10027169_29040 [Gordonia jinhuaensis]|uniref:Uncharacterized protein n=1 Tax=Gordonia jinhuaensis TaxID=1517702 RepID=A0A916T9Q0_9ACTN|nr:hypothetical protein GCM10011489_25080 [Gordonia jinhuaensis]
MRIAPKIIHGQRPSSAHRTMKYATQAMIRTAPAQVMTFDMLDTVLLTAASVAAMTVPTGRPRAAVPGCAQRKTRRKPQRKASYPVSALPMVS